MRNQVVFNNAKAYPSRVALLAFNMANDHTNANKKNLISSRKQHGLIRWQPPRGDFFKLNFDGSVQNSAAAAGFIIRNEHGEPVIAGARSLGETSINVAECLALRDALWIARSKGFWKVLVEGDSKLVIDAVQGTSGVPWRVTNIFEDIKIIARSFE
ncbi:uncharacterized protein [Malus domestica]|uniref:uncharacterized protein n=1 Tax=Malus domestica TaxID=3750 RepID=UPI0004991409